MHRLYIDVTKKVTKPVISYYFKNTIRDNLFASIFTVVFTCIALVDSYPCNIFFIFMMKFLIMQYFHV